MRPPRCYRTSLELAPHNPITLNNLGTTGWMAKGEEAKPSLGMDPAD